MADYNPENSILIVEGIPCTLIDSFAGGISVKFNDVIRHVDDFHTVTIVFKEKKYIGLAGECIFDLFDFNTYLNIYIKLTII